MQTNSPTNAATIILRAGLNKKVGLPNFGSFGAEFHVEVVTDLGILSSPEHLDSVRSKMFNVCFESIETQIRMHTEGAQAPAAKPSTAPVSASAAAPANGLSPFGQWIRDKAEAYGLPIATLVKPLYSLVFPDRTMSELKTMGTQLAAKWSELPNPAEMFESWLTTVFETLEIPAS